MLAKSDVLPEVVDGQRLKIDFVVFPEVTKSPRLKFLIPGSLVRVQPGVLQKLAGTMPAYSNGNRSAAARGGHR